MRNDCFLFKLCSWVFIKFSKCLVWPRSYTLLVILFDHIHCMLICLSRDMFDYDYNIFVANFFVTDKLMKERSIFRTKILEFHLLWFTAEVFALFSSFYVLYDLVFSYYPHFCVIVYWKYICHQYFLTRVLLLYIILHIHISFCFINIFRFNSLMSLHFKEL